MSQQIDLWNYVYPILFARLEDLVDVSLGKGDAISQFRMTLILVIVIDPQDECVDVTRCKFLVDKFYESFQFIRFWCANAKSANREIGARFILAPAWSRQTNA